MIVHDGFTPHADGNARIGDVNIVRREQPAVGVSSTSPLAGLARRPPLVWSEKATDDRRTNPAYRETASPTRVRCAAGRAWAAALDGRRRRETPARRRGSSGALFQRRAGSREPELRAVAHDHARAGRIVTNRHGDAGHVMKPPHQRQVLVGREMRGPVADWPEQGAGQPARPMVPEHACELVDGGNTVVGKISIAVHHAARRDLVVEQREDLRVRLQPDLAAGTAWSASGRSRQQRGREKAPAASTNTRARMRDARRCGRSRTP